MNTKNHLIALSMSFFPMANKKQPSVDFTKMENCPSCKKSWKGEPIPQESIDNGFYDASSKFFSKVIGLYSMEEDRTFAYRCPFCGSTWDRNTRRRIPDVLAETSW